MLLQLEHAVGTFTLHGSFAHLPVAEFCIQGSAARSYDEALFDDMEQLGFVIRWDHGLGVPFGLWGCSKLRLIFWEST